MSDLEFTKDWWRRCIADNHKMTLWLQKLQRTELSGYTDHIEFMATHKISNREQLILTNIANDELKHSGLLIDLFADRKIEAVPVGEESSYWLDILKDVQTFEDYCAANYFGEALAAFRFDVIHSMPETPADIRELISKVLPDEIFHRETLQRLAGDDTLARMKLLHDVAYAKLINRK